MKTNKEIITAIASSTKDEALKHLLTKTNDIETLADTILANDYQVQKNAFLSTLINTIAFRIVSKKIIKNKLSELKKGKLPFGTTFQHIVANPQKGTPYNLNSSDLLKVCIPDTKSVYFQLIIPSHFGHQKIPHYPSHPDSSSKSYRNPNCSNNKSCPD